MAYSTYSSIGRMIRNNTATQSNGNDIISTSGLVYYYKCESGDVSGGLLKNMKTGGGYDLTLVNSPIQNTTYKLGTGGLGNGSNGSAYNRNIVGFTDSAISISFWFYPSNSQNNTVQTILLIGYSSVSVVNNPSDVNTFSELEIRFSSNGSNSNIIYVFARNSQISQINVTANQWMYYTFVKNGSNAYVYVNGNSTPSTTDSSGASIFLTNTNSICQWLKYYGGNSRQCFSYVDEVRIYNRSLNTTEIATLYNYTG